MVPAAATIKYRDIEEYNYSGSITVGNQMLQANPTSLAFADFYQTPLLTELKTTLAESKYDV